MIKNILDKQLSIDEFSSLRPLILFVDVCSQTYCNQYVRHDKYSVDQMITKLKIITRK